MSTYSRGTHRDRKSSGGSAINVLLFLGGALLIVVIVILLHKASDQPTPPPPAEIADNTAPPPAKTDDSDYVKRGLLPNGGKRVGGDNETVKVSTPVAKGFVGDSKYLVYHRPDCRRVRLIDIPNKVAFATVDEAFARNYIPCKTCDPGLPNGVTEVPSRPGPKTTDTRTSSGGPKPVSAAIQDVTVPFPYDVFSRDPINERGVIRIEFEVNVLRKLTSDEVVLLARKLVAQETAKGPISAVSLLVHTDRAKTSIRWLAMIDWAPFGVLTRAGERKPGDYKDHQFNIYDQGTFIPKKH